MGITIGESYTFDYPPCFETLPDYSAHIGQTVKVLREMEDGVEYDREDGESAFEIEAGDGWRGMAYESELLAPGETRKWSGG